VPGCASTLSGFRLWRSYQWLLHVHYWAFTHDAAGGCIVGTRSACPLPWRLLHTNNCIWRWLRALTTLSIAKLVALQKLHWPLPEYHLVFDRCRHRFPAFPMNLTMAHPHLSRGSCLLILPALPSRYRAAPIAGRIRTRRACAIHRCRPATSFCGGSIWT